MAVPVRDASCHFSADDWNLLQEWQKELCGNVMKEINRALVLLGPLVARIVFSLETKGRQQLHHVDNQESERRDRVTSSPSDSNTSDCELIIKEEHFQLSNPKKTEERHDCLSREEPASIFIDHLGEEIKESSADPDLGVPLITSVFSLRIKPEEKYCVQETTEPKIRTSGLPTRKHKKSMNEYKRPRTAFTDQQLKRLEREFQASRYITWQRRKTLSQDLNMKESQIMLWFQNKRSRSKRPGHEEWAGSTSWPRNSISITSPRGRTASDPWPGPEERACPPPHGPRAVPPPHGPGAVPPPGGPVAAPPLHHHGAGQKGQ